MVLRLSVASCLLVSTLLLVSPRLLESALLIPASLLLLVVTLASLKLKKKFSKVKQSFYDLMEKGDVDDGTTDDVLTKIVRFCFLMIIIGQ